MDTEKLIMAVCGLIKSKYGVDLLENQVVKQQVSVKKGGRQRDSKGRFLPVRD